MKLPLDKFRIGYIILYKNNGGLFGNLIEKRQLAAGFTPDQACWTHAEISGGEKESVYTRMPLSARVDITKAHKGQTVRLLRYDNKAYEEGKRYKVGWFNGTLNNLPYDGRGVLAFLKFLKRWIKQSTKLYFCSEGVLWALQKVFPAAMFGLKPEECMPAHFAASDEFKVVWEGVIA